MINLNYIALILKKNKGLAIFSTIVVSLLFYLIIWLLTLLDVPSLHSSMLAFLPKKFQLFISDQFISTFSLSGTIAFAYNHPLVLTMFALNAILLPSSHINGELSEGTLELLLTFPIKRINLLISLWFSIILQLLIIVSISFGFALLAILIYHSFSWILFFNMAKIGINLWLFFICISTISILFNAYGNSVTNTGIRSAGLLLLFYLTHFVTSLWEKISFIKPFNIFTYFEPNKLMFGQTSIIENAIVLSGLTLIFLLLSIIKFDKKDII